jgi:para-nitrobenzyl esterase
MSGTLVTTTAGRVAGRERAGVVFRGIPYAAPPVGALRFRPPRPPARWDGVRDCARPGPACTQGLTGGSGGVMRVFDATGPMSEDCLYLDVWTPAPDGEPRPVMVWLHGGGFRSGSGACPLYDGDALVGEGVVVVTVNYRLHAFGFLYLDELFHGASGTGNTGLLDQLAALAWVQDNIAAFGGDPGNITVFGESAGAMSVGALLAMGAPVRRAIAQSGAGHHAVSRAGAGAVARRVLGLLGVRPGDWDALLGVSAAALTAAAASAGLDAGALLADEFSAAMPFQPVIDGVVLTARPIARIDAGAATGVDVVVGTCADELRVVAWGMPAGLQRRHLDPSVARVLGAPGVAPADVTSAYRGVGDELDVHLAMETDYRYAVPAVSLAEHQGRHARTWLYRFSWPTPVAGGQLRACHGVDVPFVFGTFAHARSLVGRAPPAALSATVRRAWARFAATGDPGWPPYSPRERAVMDFDVRSSVVHNPLAARREAWWGVVESWCGLPGVRSRA